MACCSTTPNVAAALARRHLPSPSGKAPEPMSRSAAARGAGPARVKTPGVVRHLATKSRLSEHPYRRGLAVDHPYVTRPAGHGPTCAQPVKAFESRCGGSVIPTNGNFLIRPVRTAASQSIAPGLSGSASPIWDRFREQTLVGILRHSKRFFGSVRGTVFLNGR